MTSSIKAALRTTKTSLVGMMYPDFTFLTHLFQGNRYITGKSYGGISFDSAYNFFPSWKLETWNSFCITANSVTKIYKTFINGKERNGSSSHRNYYFSPQEVLRLTDYEGFHQKRKGNIFLLNAFFKDSGFSYPMKEGPSITDPNTLIL